MLQLQATVFTDATMVPHVKKYIAMKNNCDDLTSREKTFVAALKTWLSQQPADA
jgi:hypothetical protein